MCLLASAQTLIASEADAIAISDNIQNRYWIDPAGVYPACGDDRACAPIPVDQRVNTDSLWQRSPFLLYGGGIGQMETAGIDHILPYWMARFYGLAL